jgi:hypothetical protein
VELKLLVLENDATAEKTFINELKKVTSEEPYILVALLWRNETTLIHYLKMAEKVAFKSSFYNEEQVNLLMEIFSKLQRKTVYIKTDNKVALEKHSLYKANSIKHEIIYL